MIQRNCSTCDETEKALRAKINALEAERDELAKKVDRLVADGLEALSEEEMRRLFGDENVDADAKIGAFVARHAVAKAEDKATIERLQSVLQACFELLPVVPGDALAWCDHNLTPHVVKVVDEFAILEKQVEAFKRSDAALRGLLREMEWADKVTDGLDWYSACFVCDRIKPDHEPDCRLAAELKEESDE